MRFTVMEGVYVYENTVVCETKTNFARNTILGLAENKEGYYTFLQTALVTVQFIENQKRKGCI